MSTIRISYVDENGDDQERTLPARWAICDRCDGHGVHDPDAFSDGFSSQDFANDPDFAEEYFAGRYDVCCSECSGSGKVLVPAEEQLTTEQAQALACYREAQEHARECDRIRDAERRAGA